MVSQLGKGFSALQVHSPVTIWRPSATLQAVCGLFAFHARSVLEQETTGTTGIETALRRVSRGGGQQRSCQTLPPHKHTSKRMDERVVRVKVQHLPQAVPLQQSGLGM